MAGYITQMTTPLPPHVLADLHKVCRYDPLAVNTIDMLVHEITRVSKQIAAVAPDCSDLAVAFNTQFLPADHVPQQPSGRGVALSTPPPSPCLPRLAKRSLGAHSDITTSMPSKDCRSISDANVLDSTLFGTEASTISFETRSDDDEISAIEDKLCAEYDALNNMLRKKFGDLPVLSGDPDTSVLADVDSPKKDVATRHPGSDHDQPRPHGSTGLLPTAMLPSLPTPSDLPKTDRHEVWPSKQAGTPDTGDQLLAEPPITTFGGDRHEKQAPSREHQAPGSRARRLICTYNGLTSQGRRPDRPAVQHPHEPRPSHLPPGCHVCNIEHTLHAEDDDLVMCNHPDGCGQLAHIDTCARECPRHPDKMICNLCHCREHVFVPRPEPIAPRPQARRIISTYNGLTSQGRRPAPPALQYPYEQRPDHLPPGCHVCNREYTLHAEDDQLVMCNHPDGCGQVAHPDTCARACPQYPDKMICNLCYRPEHVLDSRPDLISASTTLPSQSVWSLLDDVDANSDNAPTWVWSPHVAWSPTAGCFQGQVVGTPGDGHVCNPYCVHSYGQPRVHATPLTPLQLRLQALLRTAQNLAECHTLLANRGFDSSDSDNAKRRKKGD